MVSRVAIWELQSDPLDLRFRRSAVQGCCTTHLEVFNGFTRNTGRLLPETRLQDDKPARPRTETTARVLIFRG